MNGAAELIEEERDVLEECELCDETSDTIDSGDDITDMLDNTLVRGLLGPQYEVAAREQAGHASLDRVRRTC